MSYGKFSIHVQNGVDRGFKIIMKSRLTLGLLNENKAFSKSKDLATTIAFSSNMQN